MRTKNFALLGLSGYIAPRHLKAIRDTDNQLIVAFDKNDSVGIIDSFFPKADFFTEFERFDRHLEKLKQDNVPLDYVSICTPNYLHDAHIRMALRRGAHAICEKPLVLNPWNIDALANIEKEHDCKIFNILQLRLHPSIVALREQVRSGPADKIYDIDLSYITSRGSWYQYSWKGDVSKSGGIATNIGVHFFDMLSWVFGDVINNEVHYANPKTMAGYLEFKKARVRWFLSIDSSHLPKDIVKKGQRTFRSITIEGKEMEFSDGFTDLHLASYRNILEGKGFGLEEARPSITIVHQIRNAPVEKNKKMVHPFVARVN